MQVKSLGGIMNRLLKKRERMVLEMRYGINMEEEMTQREIAKKLGISRSYISRIEKKAIEKLKTELEKQE